MLKRKTDLSKSNVLCMHINLKCFWIKTINLFLYFCYMLILTSTRQCCSMWLLLRWCRSIHLIFSISISFFLISCVFCHFLVIYKCAFHRKKIILLSLISHISECVWAITFYIFFRRSCKQAVCESFCAISVWLSFVLCIQKYYTELFLSVRCAWFCEI